MKNAIFTVSMPRLVDVLHLPRETEIQSVGVDKRGDLVIICAHPDLKDAGEGGVLAAEPTFTRDAEGVKFLGWGQK